MAEGEQIVALIGEGKDTDAALLDSVFFALSDPVRRAILERLGEEALLVSAPTGTPAPTGDQGGAG